MLHLWNEYLYRPLFNVLIWIYNNWTDANMGWAIVYMTVALRVALLPFTLVGERNDRKNSELIAEVESIDKTYHKDPVLKKQEIRRMLRERRIKPWATVVVLAVQALVLVLLYQVFVRGITGDKILKVLYRSIDFPGMINTNFFGSNLAERHNVAWAAVVAVFLGLEIYLESRHRRIRVGTSDLVYFVVFPLGVFAILWWLPMVKSLFVLTSIIFSAIIGQFSKILFKPKKQAVHGH